MTTVALDGRGAERGAQAIVEGARLAAADGIGLRVFGDPAELAALSGIDGVELIEAAGQITNDDEPVAAVRSREDASVVMAAADVASGRSDALASAGSTGATMAAALFGLRRMRGVRRPALALQLLIPGREGPPILMLDVGANTDARANDLVQFAHLGVAFSSAVHGVERPRVALISVGEESKKGNAEVVDAHAALAGSSSINFVGNVEGRDLLAGHAQVIVTDGFTGNVVLKTIEGTASAVAAAVRDAARSGPVSALGGALLRPALGELRRGMDPDTTGGAILLGLRGVAVVGHGSSGPLGVANAVRLAARSVEHEAVRRTSELLASSHVTRGELRDNEAGSQTNQEVRA
ncbi:phosphate acyltransferase PlsX [Thermoleophilia bacterium SCSIO 60948]|nr:phosphate acyltransferase PlsX [Thermoleophilia bacterium SCSIO 60948]